MVRGLVHVAGREGRFRLDECILCCIRHKIGQFSVTNNIYQRGRAEVVPVEVKSGRNVRARSLRKLVEEGHAPRAYRLSEQNFSESTIEGTGCTLAGLPLYAAFTLGS